MKAKHTNGPWKIADVKANGLINECFAIVANDNNGEWWHIAGVWNDCESLKASECNANLISAAPELLAALEAGVDNEISMIDWMKMARVAIAKAKGLQ